MKKKLIIIAIVVVVVVAIGLVGFRIYRYPDMFRNLSDKTLNTSQTETLKEEIFSKKNPKVLVAYYSYSGTTKKVADEISKKTNGDLFEITTKEKYSNVYTQSNSEIRNDAHPLLKYTVDNIDQYDIVFVGYPIWWHATPTPINTFLESYNLKDKIVIPFCTSAENDIEQTMPTFLNSCDGLAVYGEKRLANTSEIDSWLKDIDFPINK